MKKFATHFEGGAPRIVIGSQVPPGSINLAYVETPELFADQAVKTFNQAHSLPENQEAPLPPDEAFYVDESGYLRTEDSSMHFPTEDVLITNLYSPVEKTPLFWLYTARFYHFEVNPPWVQHDAHVKRYTGERIRLLEEGSPVSFDYLIQLEETETESVWQVHLYLPVSGEELQLSYHKTDLLGESRLPGFLERVNERPLFQRVDLSDLINYTDEDRVFAVEPSPHSHAFSIKTAQSAQKVERESVRARWRINADGETSAWFPLQLAPEIEQKELEEGLYVSRLIDGSMQYVRIVYPDVFSHFDIAEEDAESILIEHEIWEDGVGWTEDTDSLISFRFRDTSSSHVLNYLTQLARLWLNHKHPVRGEVFAYLNAGHVLKKRSDAVRLLGSEPEFKVAITAECASQEDPGYVHWINHASFDEGAEISVDAPEGFTQEGDSLRIIDETNTAPFDRENRGILPSAEWRIWKAQNDLTPSIVSLEITLDGSKSFKELALALGSKGLIEDVAVWDGADWQTLFDASDAKDYLYAGDIIPDHWGNAQDLTWWLYHRRWRAPHRFYRFHSNDPITTSKIRVQLKTEVYRDIRRLYIHDWTAPASLISEANMIGIWAFGEDSGALAGKWRRRATFTGKSSFHQALQANFLDLIDELGLNPPAGVDPEEVTYQVEWIRGEWATQCYFVGSNGKSLLKTDSLKMTRQEAIGKEIVFMSDSYTPHTFSDDTFRLWIPEKRIELLPPEPLGTERPWFPRIRDGRITRITASGERLDYFVSETGIQSFDPVFPYRRVQNEEVQFVDRNTVRIRRTPLFVEYDANGAPTNLKVYRNQQELTVIDWNQRTGDIQVEESIAFTDELLASYTFEERHYLYQGYYDAERSTFFSLDLNPSPGHTYTDHDGNIQPSAHLLEKIIVLYLLPCTKVHLSQSMTYSGRNKDPNAPLYTFKPLIDEEEELDTMHVVDPSLEFSMEEDSFTEWWEEVFGLELPWGQPNVWDDPYVEGIMAGGGLRHLIVDLGTSEEAIEEMIQEIHPDALILGKYMVRNPYSPESVKILDTRRRGGGFLSSLSFEAIDRLSSESTMIWDVGSLDGKVYPSNGVAVLSLKRSHLVQELSEPIWLSDAIEDDYQVGEIVKKEEQTIPDFFTHLFGVSFAWEILDESQKPLLEKFSEDNFSFDALRQEISKYASFGTYFLMRVE